MKVKIWDRLLCALSGLILIALGLALFVHISGVLSFVPNWRPVNTLLGKVIVISCSAIIILLGVHGIMMLFRNPNQEKGFIIQSTEYGDVSISIHAMENMVNRCACSHKEITVKDISLRRDHEGIGLDLRVLLQNGLNIPQTVTALQKELKDYIHICSGVPVGDVRVMVEMENSKSAGRNIIEVPSFPQMATPPFPVQEMPRSETTPPLMPAAPLAESETEMRPELPEEEKLPEVTEWAENVAEAEFDDTLPNQVETVCAQNSDNENTKQSVNQETASSEEL